MIWVLFFIWLKIVSCKWNFLSLWSFYKGLRVLIDCYEATSQERKVTNSWKRVHFIFIVIQSQYDSSLFNPFPCLHPLLSLFQFNFSAWIAAPAPLLIGQTAAKAASKTGTFFCQDFFLCLFQWDFFLTQGFTPCYSPPPTQRPPCLPMSKTALSWSTALLKSWNCRLGMRWNGKI